MRQYPKIPHLPGSRTGSSDRHCDLALAERLTLRSRDTDRIVVQEKLDGTCVAVVRQAQNLLALGREGRLCSQSLNPNRRDFALWLERNVARLDWLEAGERLVCEWLPVAHGTRYALPHEPIVVLDLFCGNRRTPLEELTQRLTPSALPQPQVLHVGNALPLESALEQLGTYGHHGAHDPAEGLVYRLEDAHVCSALAKFVRHAKHDGIYLDDYSGLEPVLNTWLPRAEAGQL